MRIYSITVALSCVSLTAAAKLSFKPTHPARQQQQPQTFLRRGLIFDDGDEQEEQAGFDFGYWGQFSQDGSCLEKVNDPTDETSDKVKFALCEEGNRAQLWKFENENGDEKLSIIETLRSTSNNSTGGGFLYDGLVYNKAGGCLAIRGNVEEMKNLKVLVCNKNNAQQNWVSDGDSLSPRDSQQFCVSSVPSDIPVSRQGTSTEAPTPEGTSEGTVAGTSEGTPGQTPDPWYRVTWQARDACPNGALFAQVKDYQGNPVNGTNIGFLLVGADGNTYEGGGQTDQNGQFIFDFTADMEDATGDALWCSIAIANPGLPMDLSQQEACSVKVCKEEDMVFDDNSSSGEWNMSSPNTTDALLNISSSSGEGDLLPSNTTSNSTNASATVAVEGDLLPSNTTSNATDFTTPDTDGVTRQECFDQGGTVADYICESNGLPFVAILVQDDEGGPAPMEGEVCCGPALIDTDTTDLTDTDTTDDDVPDAKESFTRQECVDQGGSVVGDIGDGAIYQENYRCESNGAPPVANIVPAEGEPVAIEGEVCCGPSLTDNDPVARPTVSRRDPVVLLKCEDTSSLDF